jgi:hypothetical protein
MSSTASQHYQAALRLLGTVEETPGNAVFLAMVHALLAQAPRRARRSRVDASTRNGLPAHLHWPES